MAFRARVGRLHTDLPVRSDRIARGIHEHPGCARLQGHAARSTGFRHARERGRPDGLTDGSTTGRRPKGVPHVVHRIEGRRHRLLLSAVIDAAGYDEIVAEDYDSMITGLQAKQRQLIEQA